MSSKHLQLHLYLSIAAALSAGADAFIKSANDLAADGSGGNGDADTTIAPTAATITPEQISNEARDSSGLPYDARIHAETRGVNKDGTWKRRRNVSDEIVDAVTAELRATVGTAAPAATVTAAPAASTPVVTPPPPAATVVQIPLPVTAPVANDYTKLCDFLAKNTGEGTSLPDAWVGAFFEANTTTLPALASEPDKAGKLLASLRDTLAQYNIAEVV